MKINCIAIDDEPLALEKLTEFIRRVDYLELSGVFFNPLDAISFLKEEKVDLIFLDIQMEELSGIEFIETINPDASVIITTAHSQYALKGYELRVHDYLLKPISFTRFVKAVGSLYNDLHKTKSETSQAPDNLFVKSGNTFRNIRIDEILYVEGMKDYLRIWTTKEGIMTLMSFQQLIDQLPVSKFIRIHRSYLVAVSKMDELTKNRVRIGEKYLPIGETFKEELHMRIR